VSGAVEAIDEVSQRLRLADFLHGQDICASSVMTSARAMSLAS
jgi:hypothetical protein